jgi:hypothetical protein
MAAEEEREARPWEQPGQLRRDALPHRGTFLLILATVSVVCGYLSCCLVVPSFVGLTCAVAAFVVSTEDLARMRAGLMDPRGYGLTDAANSRSITGVILNGLVVGYVSAFLACLLSRLS